MNRLVLLVCALLSACGGGSESPITVNAGSNCDISYTAKEWNYTVTGDPLLVNQWHLVNTGQSGGLSGEDIGIGNVWSKSRGQGVTVAILDDAVELTHPDIQPNTAPGSISFRPGNRGGLPLPCKRISDTHGTAVAGIIAAGNTNGIGGSGVAPDAKIIAYDVLSSNLQADFYTALTGKAWIYHNSWGSRDTGAVRYTSSTYNNAIKLGISSGRGGLGSIFVFASGNGGPNDNANLDGFLNKQGVITVGSVDDWGRRTPRSEPGANILVSAPGVGSNYNIVTTALDGKYRNDFSGSSASAPMVTGVVALILAARPDLSWRDVMLILAASARKNDPGDSGWRRAFGGGGWVHPFYGYGVVNAEAAVNLALGWTSVGDMRDLKTCSSELISVDGAIPQVPIGAGIKSTVSVLCPQISRIEFIEVELTTTHESHGDLRIELESASGYTSVLANSRLCTVNGVDPCGAYSGWKFGVLHHMDEPATGFWSLTIKDQVIGNTGTFESWRIIVHGR